MQQPLHCHAASAADEPAPMPLHVDVGDADQIHGRSDQWHDPVTGLPRPHCFLEHLERVLATPARRSRPVALLVLEVVGFDALIGHLGEPCCQELLRAIAERLHEAVPEPNLVTRLGRGAFAIVLHDLGPEVAPEALATHLLERASAPHPSGDRLLRWQTVGALAMSRHRADSALELFDRATRSLARAKLRSQLAAGGTGGPV